MQTRVEIQKLIEVLDEKLRTWISDKYLIRASYDDAFVKVC